MQHPTCHVKVTRFGSQGEEKGDPIERVVKTAHGAGSGADALKGVEIAKSRVYKCQTEALFRGLYQRVLEG